MSDDLDDILGEDKTLDEIINEAGSSLDDDAFTKEQLEIRRRRQAEIDDLRDTLKTARKLGNRDWATELIKGSVDNAIIGQQLAIQDIEDDYQSKKVTSLAELTNAITNGAKEVVDMEHKEQHLGLAREKNELRRLEITGGKGKLIDADKDIKAIGTGRDLLKLMKKDINIEEKEGNDE